MQVRREQADALEQYQVHSFERDIAAHLKEFNPRHCAVIGDDGLREVVRLGLARATSNGLTQRDTIRLYLDLMFMFGSYFDSDPQHPWAAEALNDALISEPLFRATALHQNMVAYLNDVSGPRREYALEAMRATRRMMDEPIGPVADLASDIVQRFHRVHPRKCAWLGGERLQAIMYSGFEVAEEHQVTSVRGRTLLAMLSFALGHKYATDPLYPWIERTLEDELVADPNRRVERLEKKCQLYLDRVLDGWGEP